MASVKSLSVQSQPAGSGVGAGPTEANHIVRKADLDAALSDLNLTDHPPVTVADTDSVTLSLGGGQALTAVVRRKLTEFASGEGLIGSGASGLFVSLGTGPNVAAKGDHGHNDATTSAAGFLSATDKARLDNLAASTVWLASVATREDLPLAGDPQWAYRIVRGEKRIYEHFATTGAVGDQWQVLDSPLRYAETIGDGVETEYDVVHGRGTMDVVVSVREAAGSKAAVAVNWAAVDENTVRLSFGVIVGVGEMRVVVLG